MMNKPEYSSVELNNHGRFIHHLWNARWEWELYTKTASVCGFVWSVLINEEGSIVDRVDTPSRQLRAVG